MEEGTQKLFWYAANMVSQRKEILKCLQDKGIRTYSVALMPRLIFIRCSSRECEDLRQRWWGSLMFYLKRASDKDATKVPAVIRDSEMTSFIIVSSTNPDDLIQLDIPDPEFLAGQRVRVKDGPFKGAEGVVKRVKGDRRLIVEVKGITVVATSFIHPSLLEPIE